jgi:predicted RNase H-like nuclease (RuvC/YqgF family)
MAITAHRVMWTENKPKWEKALAEAKKERDVMKEDYAIYTTRAKEYNDLYKKITELKRKLSAEELRYPELSDYLEVVENHIEKCWTNSVRILASKTLAHGGINGYKVQHLSFNEARIEALFSCEGKKSLYARLIWAAEYSCLVSPHERYIVTER